MAYACAELNVLSKLFPLALCFVFFRKQCHIIIKNYFLQVEVNSEQLFAEVEVNILGFSPTMR